MTTPTRIWATDWFVNVFGEREAGRFNLRCNNPLVVKRKEGYDHQIILAWTYGEKTEDGLPDDTLQDRMDDFEALVCDAWTMQGLVVLRAVFTYEKTCQWILDTHDVQKCCEQFRAAIKKRASYPVELLTASQPRWNQLRSQFVQTMDYLEHLEEWECELKRGQKEYEFRNKKPSPPRSAGRHKEYKIDEILALPTSIEIVYRLSEELRKHGPHFNDSEAAVMNALEMADYVMGDGLMAWFDNHPAPFINASRQALRLIGASKHLTCLEKALTLFPDSLPPENNDEYFAILANFTKEQRKIIEEMESQFYAADLDENICLLIHQFVTKNTAHFR